MIFNFPQNISFHNFVCVFNYRDCHHDLCTEELILMKRISLFFAKTCLAMWFMLHLYTLYVFPSGTAAMDLSSQKPRDARNTASSMTKSY